MSTRLDRLQAGFFSVFTAEIPNTSVQWAYQQPSFEQLQSNMINIELLTGPTKIYLTRARGRTILPPTSITLSVPSVIVGKRYYVEINDFLFFHDAIGGDTVDTIRDALVVAINTDPNDPYSASSTVNPGEFTILPESFGSIWQVAISSNITVIDLTLSNTPVLLTEGTRDLTVNLQTFSKSPSPRTGAWSIMDKIQDITETQELVDQLWDVFGIRIIDFGVVTNLSAIAGASWESRCTSDVRVQLRSQHTRATEAIESVNFTIQTKAPGGLTSWEDTISF